MNVADYPVTTPFGQVPGYPLNNGFHNGIDYGCPNGTSVVVNGVTIGISNNTGASTGPHCHVGKWVGGKAQDPGVGNGFHFNSAVVYDTGSDPTNGNFVRITGDGALWCYLHLQTILVTKGQVLKGAPVATDSLTKEEIQVIYDGFFETEDYQVPQDIIAAYTGKPLSPFLTQLANDPTWLAHKQAVNNPTVPGSTTLAPGLYKVN